MGNGVGAQRRWRSEPDLAERRRQQQSSQSPAAAAAYTVSSGATAQSTGRRKAKNPVLRAIRALANAPNKIGRAAGRSQQPPPLPPRAGRPPPPPLSQQRGTPLGFMPERARGLEQQQAVAPQARQLSSSGLSSSMQTLATADDRPSPVPAPSGGRYLSQSCSNLVYGQQSSLYPPLNSLNTIEQESDSGSDVDGGEPQTEQPPQPIYSAVESDHERELPCAGRDDEVDNEMSLYADLDDIHGLHHKQGTDVTADPQSERLSMAVRAATRARTISSLHAFSQAEPSAPPMPSDYTLSRNANCSAATDNQLGNRFMKSITEKRQMYDDLISKLTAVCCPDKNDTRKAQAGGLGAAGLAPPPAATAISLVQQTLKELYYLHALLHGHIAEDLSMDLLPEVGQKAYSFWESLHQLILKHHEELDRADAVCAAEILRNPLTSHLTSVLGEHFKMQRFLLQRQRAERNAELDTVRRTVSANASWAAAAAEEAPVAAAAAGLEVAAARLPRTRSETTAHVNSDSAVGSAEGYAASAVATSAARAPANRTPASQVVVGSTREIAAFAGSGVKRALPNEYHKPHVGGAQQSVVALSSVRHAPAAAAAAAPTASACVAAAAPGCAVSPPAPAAAARADAGGPRPAEAVYSSLAPPCAPVKASVATHHLNSPPAAVQVRSPSAAPSAAAVAVGTLSADAATVTATAAEVRQLSAAMSDRSANRPLLVSCACQTDDNLSDDGRGSGLRGPGVVSRATDAAVGAVQRIEAACDSASEDAANRTAPPEAAPKTSTLIATLTALSAPSAERRRDATGNCRASSGDEGSVCLRSGTAAAAGTTDNDALSAASSDNPLYMLHSSDGGFAARSGGSVAMTREASRAFVAAEDTLHKITAVAQSGSRSRGRQPLAAPRTAALEQRKLALQPEEQKLQTDVKQLAQAAEQSEQTNRASVTAASKETKCLESGTVTTPETVAAQRTVQGNAVAQRSRPLPPTSARSADSASGTFGGAGGGEGPVDASPRRQTDVEDIAVRVHTGFGNATMAAAEEQPVYYELLEDAADNSRVLINGAMSVAPKQPPLSSPIPSPLASMGGLKTGSPMPPSSSGGSMSVKRPHKEEEKEEEEDDDPGQQRQQYAANEAVSECAYANAEERRSTTDKGTIDADVTSFGGRSATASAAARPAEAAKLQPLSARSAVVQPSLDARSGAGAERATSPAGGDYNDEPVYETMPCDEVATAGRCGDEQVSVVQRVPLRPMEDVLRSSVGQQQPPLPPLPRATEASSSKNAAGAGDKSGRMPGKKKAPAKILSATASRYALLTDDDDQDSV